MPRDDLEDEVVIRDPAPTTGHLWVVIAGIPIGLAYLAFRLWLRGKWLGEAYEPYPSASLAVVLAYVFIGCLSLVKPPVWIRVGPDGLAFRSWWSSGRFSWASIDSFEVGNPSDPQFAYVTLRSPTRARQLPALKTVSPDELVRTLRDEQRRFSVTSPGRG